jgi:hypothetical protein
MAIPFLVHIPEPERDCRVAPTVTQDQLLNRLRESLTWLTGLPDRTQRDTADRQEDAHTRVQEALRLLARSRVSDLLRQLRAALNLSYADVQAMTGLSQQLLYDVEFKDRRLTLEELRLLADCYRVSVNDLLGVDIEE